MIKGILSTVAVAGVLFVCGPAFADCAADMKTTDAMVAKATDAAKKDAAAKEMAMAKDMMDKKDEAGCMTHVSAAMKAVQ